MVHVETLRRTRRARFSRRLNVLLFGLVLVVNVDLLRRPVVFGLVQQLEEAFGLPFQVDDAFAVGEQQVLQFFRRRVLTRLQTVPRRLKTCLRSSW